MLRLLLDSDWVDVPASWIQVPSLQRLIYSGLPGLVKIIRLKGKLHKKGFLERKEEDRVKKWQEMDGELTTALTADGPCARKE
jgi:hypothetical protein